MSSEHIVRTGASAATPSKALVLVIDDQAVNVRLVAALLLQSGYAVLSAVSGAEGLALARASRPDIVLLDMRMPGMDGFEVLRELRAGADTADLPIIFLTADDDRENLIRAFTAGVTDYLTKPFVGRELLARVLTHVDLKQSRDAMQRSARERQELAERVAHDLRNYFANILFDADRQCATPDAGAELIELAHSIRTSADSGMLFLQAFLEQQEQRANGECVEPLSAAHLLSAAADLMAPSAAAKAITLEFQAPETITVGGLRPGIVQVLQNLLSNAIEYSPHGSCVTLAATARGNRCRMQVLDRGPGISERDQEKLFQRFVRLSSQPGGGETSTGLGLALAKQQARAMGGDLWFEPREGGGSIFTLDLPLA